MIKPWLCENIGSWFIGTGCEGSVSVVGYLQVTKACWRDWDPENGPFCPLASSPSMSAKVPVSVSNKEQLARFNKERISWKDIKLFHGLKGRVKKSKSKKAGLWEVREGTRHEIFSSSSCCHRCISKINSALLSRSSPFSEIPENASPGRIALKWKISAQQEVSVPSKEGDARQGKESQCLTLTRYLPSEYTGNPAWAGIQQIIVMVMEKRKPKKPASKGRVNRCRDGNTRCG